MTNNRKIINKFWIAALTLLMIVTTSCDLQIKETDSLISEGGSNVFNGVADPANQLTSLYNNIGSQAATQENLYALSVATTDEQFVPTRGTDWGDNGVWRTLHTHTWGNTHRMILAVWNDKNGAVLKATEVTDPLSKAEEEEVAAAKFIRAYNMWIVMDCFGQVPFRQPTDGPDVLPTVMTRADAYDFVVKDLEDAISDLPEGNPMADSKSTAVKATAQWLLAKVKLNAAVYKGEYGSSDLQDVIDLVDKIEGAGYALTDQGTYFDNFRGPDFGNTDVIWAATNVNMGSFAWNGMHYNQIHPGQAGGWNGFSTIAEFYNKFDGPNSPDVDDYKNENMVGNGQEERRGYTQTLATTNDINYGFGYGFQVGQMYGITDGTAVALKDRNGNPLIFTKEFPGLVGNNELTGIRVLKYSPANVPSDYDDPDKDEPEKTGAFRSGVVLARFADAYLMRAEAKMRMNDNAGALADVNALRAKRANTPALGAMDESTMLDERGRELYTEGWRRNDMIRFGVYRDSWEFKDSGDGHADLFPIPSSALLSNPNLIQNEGY